MFRLLALGNSLWADESGNTLSAELLLITTILGIGSITGLTTIRDQLTFELADLATAFAALNQSYSFGAITGTNFSLAGSLFNDTPDFCSDGCVAVVNGAAE